MRTNRETVHALVKSIITRLENQKSIQFPPRLRSIVSEEVLNLVKPSVFTEDDLHERTVARLGIKAEALQELAPTSTESDQYRAAKAVVRSGFGEDELKGLFFQKPLRLVAKMICEYLMRSSHIDDVYETDDDLEKQIVDIIQKFDPAQLH